MAPPAAGSTPKLSRSTPGGPTSAANAKSSALRFRQRISEAQANAGSSPAKNNGLSSPKKRLDFDQLDSGSPVSSKGKKTRMEATHDLTSVNQLRCVLDRKILESVLKILSPFQRF